MLKRTVRWLRASIWKVLVWEVLTVCVLSLVLVATITTSFQQCVADREHSYAKEDSSGYVENAASFIVCEGAVIDANSALLTAIATVLIAAFTLTLYEATNKQGRLTQKAIELARDEFVATHRPRVVLQKIVEWDFGEIKRLASVDVVIANAGETAATVLDWSAIVYIQRNDNGFSPDMNVSIERMPATFDLEAGEERRVAAVQKSLFWGSGDLMAGEAVMFLVGVICYEGNDGIRRNTGFARRLRNGHWEPLRNSEYEYAY